MGVHVFPILNPLPAPSPYQPSGSSQCTSPKHPFEGTHSNINSQKKMLNKLPIFFLIDVLLFRIHYILTFYAYIFYHFCAIIKNKQNKLLKTEASKYLRVCGQKVSVQTLKAATVARSAHRQTQNAI